MIRVNTVHIGFRSYYLKYYSINSTKKQEITLTGHCRKKIFRGAPAKRKKVSRMSELEETSELKKTKFIIVNMYKGKSLFIFVKGSIEKPCGFHQA